MTYISVAMERNTGVIGRSNQEYLLSLVAGSSTTYTCDMWFQPTFSAYRCLTNEDRVLETTMWSVCGKYTRSWCESKCFSHYRKKTNYNNLLCLILKQKYVSDIKRPLYHKTIFMSSKLEIFIWNCQRPSLAL